MSKMGRVVGAALVLTVGVAAGVVVADGSAAAPAPPRIVVKPNNVMVNTVVSLTGSGFAAKAKLSIMECSNRGWVVVAQHPCVSDNKISVATDAHGRFVRKFRVKLCPRSTTGTGPVTKETCYIGNPHPEGIDTMSLIGAARITVTYP